MEQVGYQGDQRLTSTQDKSKDDINNSICSKKSSYPRNASKKFQVHNIQLTIMVTKRSASDSDTNNTRNATTLVYRKTGSS